MKMRWMLVPVLLLAAGSAAPEPQKPARPADALRGMDEIAAQFVQLDQCHARMAELNDKMAVIFSSLKQQAAELAKIAASAQNSSAQLMQAAKQMQETQMSFNLQYLQLQNQMQNENRQYTTISNIMKTKHDTVKNTISNIR